MTITAIDAQSGNVMLVAEGHGLRLAHTRISNVGRALNFVSHPTQSGNNENRAKNCGSGQSVRTAMKNLRHAYVRVLLSKSFVDQQTRFMEARWSRCERKNPPFLLATIMRTRNYKYFDRYCRVPTTDILGRPSN